MLGSIVGQSQVLHALEHVRSNHHSFYIVEYLLGDKLTREFNDLKTYEFSAFSFFVRELDSKLIF